MVVLQILKQITIFDYLQKHLFKIAQFTNAQIAKTKASVKFQFTKN